MAALRLCIAVGVLVCSVGLYIHQHTLLHLATDPATLLYPTIILALVFRVFWARYMAICFALGMGAINVLWGPHPWLIGPGALAYAWLLSGRQMRALFEGRESRFHRWAAARPEVERLKAVFVAQAVATSVLFYGRQTWLVHANVDFGSWTIGAVVLAGIGIAGLVWQRTIALVPLYAAIAVQATLTTLMLTHTMLQGRAAIGAAIVLPLCIVISVIAPLTLVSRSVRYLRGNSV